MRKPKRKKSETIKLLIYKKKKNKKKIQKNTQLLRVFFGL